MMVSNPIPGHHFSGPMLNFGRVNDGSFVKKAPLQRLAVLFLNIGLHFLGFHEIFQCTIGDLKS